MSQLLSSNWFIIPAFGLCIFFFAYMNTDRFLSYLYDRSLGSREEIMNLLDKMFVETDKKRLTWLLLLLSFGLGSLFFLLCWPNIILGLLLGSAVTILGWSVPLTVVNSLWEKRCDRIVDQMVDGMVILSNGVKAGLSVPQSMERVTQNMKGPLPQEFKLVLNKIRLGQSVEEALTEFAERVPRQDVQMFVSAVNILKETGGNLAETFSTINVVIRERQKVEKKIQAMTTQGLTQGVIITLIPFILLIVFLTIDPNYIMPLFTKPLGWFFLFLMLGLQVIGGVMMKKVVTIKV